MKKILFTLVALSMLILPVLAVDTESVSQLEENMSIQRCIDEVGFKILNSNKIDKRMVFTYNEKSQKAIMLTDKTLTRRQIVLYQNQIEHISDKDELAAFLSREIVKGSLSYDGMFRGWISAAQMKMSPKKYEFLYDKRGVDLMANSGYNPLAMIVYLNKLGGQKRFNFVLTNNKVSKRLAEIYEYIYVKYPVYLANNVYLENQYYQNFLLTSENNRRLLQEKIRTNSTKRLKYE